MRLSRDEAAAMRLRISRTRRAGALVALLAVGVGLSGCAAPARRPSHGYRVEETVTRAEADGARPRRERWGVDQWEAWQRRQRRELGRLVAERPVDKKEAVTGGEKPGDDGDRTRRPKPPPPPDGTLPADGPRPAARPRAGGPAADKQPLRCRRVCRHVRAICHAAHRICRIAERLAEPSARQACRRGRDRCADARALVSRTCSSCGS